MVIYIERSEADIYLEYHANAPPYDASLGRGLDKGINASSIPI